MPHNFHTMLKTSKYCRLITKRIAWPETQEQLYAALRAGVLSQQKNASLCSLRCGTITKPCRKRNTDNIFRSDAAHIQNDRAEATTLQKKIGHPESLLDPRPRFANWSR